MTSKVKSVKGLYQLRGQVPHFFLSPPRVAFSRLG